MNLNPPAYTFGGFGLAQHCQLVLFVTYLFSGQGFSLTLNKIICQPQEYINISWNRRKISSYLPFLIHKCRILVFENLRMSWQARFSMIDQGYTILFLLGSFRHFVLLAESGNFFWCIWGHIGAQCKQKTFVNVKFKIRPTFYQKEPA